MPKLYFHRKIEYKILRRTEKAILIHVNKLEDSETNYHIVTNRLENYLQPLEMWCPKSWFKKFHDNEYVWINGFRKNLFKILEKRKSKLNETKTNAVIAKKFTTQDIEKLEKELDDQME